MRESGIRDSGTVRDSGSGTEANVRKTLTGVIFWHLPAHRDRRCAAAGRGGAELTPLDYIEIQQLAIRYSYGLDSTADNGYLYADVFTPDGEFVGRQVPLTQGREALARVARSVRKGNPMYVRHFIANHEIHPSPEGATGKVYLMVVDVEEGQPSSIYIGGRYEDVYVKTRAGLAHQAPRCPQHGHAAESRTLGVTVMTKSRAVLLLFFTLLLSQRAHVRAQATTPLTARDRLEINQLAARYAFALDTRADNGMAFADLFAPDGEFVGIRGTAKGRDQLAALASSGIMTAEKPIVGVSHFSMNHVIEPAAGGAIGKEYLVMVNIAEGGKPGGDFSSIGGHYEDAYVKTAAGWRFKRREFVPMKSTAPPPQSAAVPSATRAATGSGQAPAPGGRPLTADDYLAIRALANTYAYGLDTGADKGGLYASVFTEDAEFHGPPAVPGGKPFDAKGREALRQFALVDRGSAYVRHFMTNHLIEPSPEGARGKVYLLVIDIAQGDKPTSVNMGGHYEDVYVKTAAGWRITNRNFFRSKSAQTLKAEAEAAAGSAPK